VQPCENEDIPHVGISPPQRAQHRAAQCQPRLRARLCHLPQKRQAHVSAGGLPFHERPLPLVHLDPLDKEPGGDTIFRSSRCTDPPLMAGRCTWQQPMQEESCDGYATLLLSAPYGLSVQAARVLTPPPDIHDRQGVFSGVPLLLTGSTPLLYTSSGVCQSPVGHHRRETSQDRTSAPALDPAELALMRRRHRVQAGGSPVQGGRNRERHVRSSAAALAALDQPFRRRDYSSRLIYSHCSGRG
jgi:hypothetical protein